jgi:hypothetical protein
MLQAYFGQAAQNVEVQPPTCGDPLGWGAGRTGNLHRRWPSPVKADKKARNQAFRRSGSSALDGGRPFRRTACDALLYYVHAAVYN